MKTLFRILCLLSVNSWAAQTLKIQTLNFNAEAQNSNLADIRVQQSAFVLKFIDDYAVQNKFDPKNVASFIGGDLNADSGSPELTSWRTQGKFSAAWVATHPDLPGFTIANHFNHAIKFYL